MKKSTKHSIQDKSRMAFLLSLVCLLAITGRVFASNEEVSSNEEHRAFKDICSFFVTYADDLSPYYERVFGFHKKYRGCDYIPFATQKDNTCFVHCRPSKDDNKNSYGNLRYEKQSDHNNKSFETVFFDGIEKGYDFIFCFFDQESISQKACFINDLIDTGEREKKIDLNQQWNRNRIKLVILQDGKVCDGHCTPLNPLSWKNMINKCRCKIISKPFVKLQKKISRENIIIFSLQGGKLPFFTSGIHCPIPQMKMPSIQPAFYKVAIAYTDFINHFPEERKSNMHILVKEEKDLFSTLETLSLSTSSQDLGYIKRYLGSPKNKENYRLKIMKENKKNLLNHILAKSLIEINERDKEGVYWQNAVISQIEIEKTKRRNPYFLQALLHLVKFKGSVNKNFSTPTYRDPGRPSMGSKKKTSHTNCLSKVKKKVFFLWPS